MRKFEFIKPQVSFEDIENETTYGNFVITPLERGYGVTLGNALRRVLLSSMPGVAIVAMDIEGVQHEYMALQGIIEDVTEIILNLKDVVLSIDDEELFKVTQQDSNIIYELTVVAEGPGVVKAGDLSHDSMVQIVNPDKVIATLEKGGKFKARFYARRGVGYVNAEENKVFTRDKTGQTIVNRIPIDSIYTPITKCRYDVQKTRVGEQVDYDKLNFEVWTNGSIKAEDALSLASKFLIDHFSIISSVNDQIQEQEYMYEPEEKIANKKLEKRIEDLDLSVRSYNCLKRAGINTIGELTQKSEEEMMRVRNLGRKSLKEVVQKLREIGLHLKHSYGEEYDSLDDFEDDIEEDNDDSDILIKDKNILELTDDEDESSE